MVYDDSDLVVNQVMKEWDIRSPAMTSYCIVVRKLEKKFKGLELHHIPRIKNQAADDLAKIGPTRKPIPSNVRGSPRLGGIRTAALYTFAGLLDYEDTRLKTSSRVRIGLYLAWKAS